MSDEIFEVATSFTEVAELGQGYVDRADGERILLALPREVGEGEGVRFIVHLADGTPAFAGAGRCVQVSDQGAEVSADQRYETLLDSLAFDERSRPVYDYIVAVRQMAYAAAEAEAGTSDAPVEEAVYESDGSISAWPEAAPTEQMSQPPDSMSPTTEVDVATHEEHEEHEEHEPHEEMIPEQPRAAASPTDPSPPHHHQSEPASEADLSMPLAQLEASAVLASVMPEPLPTGILTRPAIAAHWQPSAPRPPRPSSRPSRFRYPAGGLPVPAAPPRPDLDPSQWVQPALRQ